VKTLSWWEPALSFFIEQGSCEVALGFGLVAHLACSPHPAPSSLTGQGILWNFAQCERGVSRSEGTRGIVVEQETCVVTEEVVDQVFVWTVSVLFRTQVVLACLSRGVWIQVQC